MVPPSYVDLSSCKLREKNATRDAVKALNRIGNNVSELAQNMFDAMSNTMPCEWNNDNIIVLETIIIKAPYGEGDCAAISNDGRADRALGQVKRVVRTMMITPAPGACVYYRPRRTHVYLGTGLSDTPAH